jgi:hypothetical protein
VPPHEGSARINRTQALVLGFAAAAWALLVVILVAAPDVFADALGLPAGDRRPAAAFLLALSVFLALLGVGVVRRWRWTFWLVLVAFLAGLLRVPASLLELAGVVPTSAPAWYVLLQAVIGIVQFAIGLAMLSSYRRAGIWGE